MALRCMKLLKTIKRVSLVRHNIYSTSSVPETIEKVKKYNSENKNNLIFSEDPDVFGTLSRKLNKDKVILEDEGDIQEDEYIKITPLPSQQLTIRQYADIIKQYLKHKRFKEALNVLEVRMKEDRVKPENYIYNILIGACADVGYTKKAFKLFNDMKKRALKATGDTYTCLFQACTNSPFTLDGQKRATHLRQLMIEKGVEPNVTNYNAMIKAFGRCGDLPAAFKIVDEMISKGIKIRVHTFNHLLQACISDKDNGLRHALIVWRKMLNMREKPNIYSFNLMLKCVKDCNMGSKADLEELISVIQDQKSLESNKKTLQIEQAKLALPMPSKDNMKAQRGVKETESLPDKTKPIPPPEEEIKLFNKQQSEQNMFEKSGCIASDQTDPRNKLAVINNNNVMVQLVKLKKPEETRTVPNLLSKQLQMEQVLSLQAVVSVQDKFAVIGGQEDFLKEMQAYSVAPDIKTFTQMLQLLENSVEAENKLLETMKAMKLFADIDFYNMLIKKRCLRSDYDAALEVKNMIEKEAKMRRRKYPLRKKLSLKTNIMTYGVLAMACKTKADADKLLSNMKEEYLKVNIEILGTLLRQGTANFDFGYVIHIMKVVKAENIKVNVIFLKHLETFKEICFKTVKSKKMEKGDVFLESYKIFSRNYKDWLIEINAEEALKPEHPWSQFNELYPDTIQRQNIQIEEPKKFYKRSKRYTKYVPCK